MPFLSSAGGGPPLSATSLAFSQAQLGLDVSVLSTARPSDERLEGLRTEIGGLPPIEYLASSESAKLPALLIAAARLRFAPGTVVHIHDPWAPAAVAIAHVSHRRDLRLVLSPRGSFGSWALARRASAKRVARFGMAQPWNSARLLHFVSEAEAGSSRGYVDVPDVVIPNGLPRRALATSRSGRDSHVMFLSRLARNKHPETALRAFARVAGDHPDLGLVLAGPDQDQMESHLKTLAHRLGVGDRVHMPGAVTGNHKYELLADAAALLHPTEQEALSMTILEALAIGVPLVTTHGANMPDLDNHGLASVCHLDETSLAEGLKTALGPSGAGRADRAQRYASDGFDWEGIAARMTDAYRAFLD